jgi:hypothetical protein
MSWVLIVFVFSVGQPVAGIAGQPVGITSVPGYTSKDDCEKARNAVERANGKLNLQIQTGCIEGPKK